MTIAYLTILLITTLAWFTISFNNPITLRLTILLTATLLSVAIILLLSSWYAIILFLIYVGGIIVMFSYFVRFNSNDSIWIKIKLQLFILPFIIIKSLNLKIILSTTPNTHIIKLYFSSNIVTMILITLILLLIIIIIIKIVKTNNAPLRGLILNF